MVSQPNGEWIDQNDLYFLSNLAELSIPFSVAAIHFDSLLNSSSLLWFQIYW